METVYTYYRSNFRYNLAAFNFVYTASLQNGTKYYTD